MHKLDSETRAIVYKLNECDFIIEFIDEFSKFLKEKPEMATKIFGKIDRMFRLFAQSPKFGLSSSSSSESLNNMISEMRKKDPFNIFRFLYFLGYEVIIRTLGIQRPLTSWFGRIIKYSRLKATRFSTPTVIRAGFAYIVIDPIKNKEYQVTIDTQLHHCSCTCGKSNDRGYPCSHVIQVLETV